MIKPPTYQRVREVLDYDPDTGLFRWRVATGRRARVGAVAGARHNQDYIHIGIDGHRILAHRLAWLWMTGSWPIAEIDHINKDRSDMRWSNLRQASHAQNGANRGANKNNKLGIKGVRFNHGSFYARIWKDGRQIKLGRFRTAKEATAAYLMAARELHREFCYA